MLHQVTCKARVGVASVSSTDCLPTNRAHYSKHWRRERSGKTTAKKVLHPIRSATHPLRCRHANAPHEGEANARVKDSAHPLSVTHLREAGQLLRGQTAGLDTQGREELQHEPLDHGVVVHHSPA